MKFIKKFKMVNPGDIIVQQFSDKTFIFYMIIARSPNLEIVCLNNANIINSLQNQTKTTKEVIIRVLSNPQFPNTKFYKLSDGAITLNKYLNAKAKTQLSKPNPFLEAVLEDINPPVH